MLTLACQGVDLRRMLAETGCGTMTIIQQRAGSIPFLAYLSFSISPRPLVAFLYLTLDGMYPSLGSAEQRLVQSQRRDSAVSQTDTVIPTRLRDGAAWAGVVIGDEHGHGRLVAF
nr:hypothetical protein L203_01500 [Cryptococcus depauperatus CBS 7841]